MRWYTSPTKFETKKVLGSETPGPLASCQAVNLGFHPTQWQQYSDVLRFFILWIPSWVEQLLDSRDRSTHLQNKSPEPKQGFPRCTASGCLSQKNWTFGCGSKIGTQNGTLVDGNKDQTPAFLCWLNFDPYPMYFFSGDSSKWRNPFGFPSIPPKNKYPQKTETDSTWLHYVCEFKLPPFYELGETHELSACWQF